MSPTVEAVSRGQSRRQGFLCLEPYRSSYVPNLVDLWVILSGFKYTLREQLVGFKIKGSLKKHVIQS